MISILIVYLIIGFFVSLLAVADAFHLFVKSDEFIMIPVCMLIITLSWPYIILFEASRFARKVFK